MGCQNGSCCSKTKNSPENPSCCSQTLGNKQFLPQTNLLLLAECIASKEGFAEEKNRIITCPKKEPEKDLSVIQSAVDNLDISSATVVTLKCDCCSKLIDLAEKALTKTKRKISLFSIVVNSNGKILSRKWV